MEQQRYLSTAQFADRLAARLHEPVRRALITDWAQTGRIVAVRIGGRWRIPESELDKILRHLKEAS